jgi:hypothetical protein
VSISLFTAEKLLSPPSRWPNAQALTARSDVTMLRYYYPGRRLADVWQTSGGRLADVCLSADFSRRLLANPGSTSTWESLRGLPASGAPSATPTALPCRRNPIHVDEPCLALVLSRRLHFAASSQRVCAALLGCCRESGVGFLGVFGACSPPPFL